jgi:hypothetical protein
MLLLDERPRMSVGEADRIIDTQLSVVRTKIRHLRKLESELERLSGHTPPNGSGRGVVNALADDTSA